MKEMISKLLNKIKKGKQRSTMLDEIFVNMAKERELRKKPDYDVIYPVAKKTAERIAKNQGR